ncbi:MAG: hypothetical protein Q8926_15785 [Bacteroidota bacterium]|nr:hypothetical protein [Bacteroidota bacterium]
MHIAWYEYFQIICLCMAIYCRKGLKACSLLAFIPLMVVVNIAELTGMNFRAFGWTSNYLIYNLYLLVSTPFFFFLAGKMLFLTKKESIIYYIVCVLSLILILVNFMYFQGSKQFNTYSLGLIEVMMIVFSGLCLLRLTVLDQEELNFMKEPYFWINSLNLLFGLITVVVLSLQSYILINQIEIAYKPLYYAIMPAVNAIVYTGYSYAFLLCRTQKTR